MRASLIAIGLLVCLFGLPNAGVQAAEPTHPKAFAPSGVSGAGASAHAAPAQTASDDGAWSAVPPPSGRYGHSAVYDPVRGRMIVFGGYDDQRRNDIWSLALGATPAWSRLSPTGTPPQARYAHTALYDPVRDRLIVFGSDDHDQANEVWTLSLSDPPVWAPLVATGTPPAARLESSAVYDPAGDRMIVFGGTAAGAPDNRVWSLTLAGSPTWAELSPTGVPPSGRYRHTVIYDPVRERMILFGGQDSSLRNDVWALSLSGPPAWVELAPSGIAPAARLRHAAFYDPVRDAMVVFGGSDDSLVSANSLHNDVWSLSLGDTPAWSEISTIGESPSPRYRHSAIYDSAHDRMVVFGGSDPNRENDLFTLDLPGAPTWTHLLISGTPPSARVGHSATYDPVNDRMIIFGGSSNGVERNDLRALSLAGIPGWSGISPTGSPPPGRLTHSSIYDPRRHRIIVFGGYDGVGYANDTWELTLDGTPVWTQLTPTGTPPSGRWWASAIYDPVRDRLILFGGNPGPPFPTLPNQVWALSLSGAPAWSPLAPSGTPPEGRYLHTAVYDAVRDRMIVFGGVGYSDGATWALSLSEPSAWSPIAPLGSPPPLLSSHNAIYDPLRDRMVVFGGLEGAVNRDDTWALSLAPPETWTALAPSGAPPSARHYAAAVYDPARDRMVLFGGDESTFVGDTWALSWNESIKPAVACGDDAGWNAGSPVDVHYPITNPLDGERAVEWTLTSQRDWPGFPLRGIALVGAAVTETVTVQVPVPDTAAAGYNALEITVAFAGAGGNDSTCRHDIHDATTATLVSLVSASAEPGRARLTWRVAVDGPVRVERRTPATAWAVAGNARTNGTGNLDFVDTSVEPGERYGYRLTWTSTRGQVIGGEVWLAVPRALQLELHGVRPTPAAAEMAVSFTLPARGRVRLECYDVTGRRAGEVVDVELSAGNHVVPFPGVARLAAGVYEIRMSFEGRQLMTRAVVVR